MTKNLIQNAFPRYGSYPDSLLVFCTLWIIIFFMSFNFGFQALVIAILVTVSI